LTRGPVNPSPVSAALATSGSRSQVQGQSVFTMVGSSDGSCLSARASGSRFDRALTIRRRAAASGFCHRFSQSSGILSRRGLLGFLASRCFDFLVGHDRGSGVVAGRRGPVRQKEPAEQNADPRRQGIAKDRRCDDDQPAAPRTNCDCVHRWSFLPESSGSTRRRLGFAPMRRANEQPYQTDNSACAERADDQPSIPASRRLLGGAADRLCFGS
jgi:hypothetical protein